MKTIAILIFVTTSLLAQQLNFPQDTLAYDELFNNRQFTSFNSEGNLQAVYSASQGTNSASREIFFLKEETGNTFSKINLTNNSVDDNYPTLSLLNGNISCVGFLSRDAANLFQVKYTDNIHGSFMPPIYITTGGLNKATPYTKVGIDSVVHFVFFTYTTGQDYVYYTKFFINDSSIQLTPTMLTDGETGGDFDAALDVDNNGKVHIVIKSGSAFGGALKYYNDINGLQQIATTATGNIVQPKIAIDKNNFVHIIYRSEVDLRLYYINNTSGAFSSPVAITPTGQRPSGYQNFSIDDSNNVFVIYQSSSSSSGKGFYLVSGKNGQFGDTVLVYDLSAGYVTRNSSTVSARGNGEIAVTYSPGAVRNSLVICDIFLKRGAFFGNKIISVSQDSVNFGNVPIENQVSVPIQVYNSGSDTLKIDSLVISDLVFMNHITPIVIPSFIPPHDSIEILTFFFPDSNLSYSGSMKIYSNANNINPVTINLYGTGVLVSLLSVDKDTLKISASTHWKDSLVIRSHAELRPIFVDSIIAKTQPPYQNIFMIEPSNFYLAPGAMRTVRVYVNITGLELQFDFLDTLYIYSNDPLHSIKKIILLYDSLPTNVSENKLIPNEFVLHQNFPNPFNPTTVIGYELLVDSYVTLKVYDILGREVTTLIDNEFKTAGKHELELNVSDELSMMNYELNTNIYFYRLTAGNFTSTKKMLYLK